MQGRKLTIFLVVIFVISIIPINKIGINSAETIEGSVKWSGIKDIDDNVIIKAGATLTIEDGATININSDISISVEGMLIIEGTISNGVNIVANILQQSELGSKSSWEGIIIQGTGVAEINGLNLNGSRNAIFADSGSVLDIGNTTISNSISGIVNLGTSEINGLNCEFIQNNCLENEGDMTSIDVNSNYSGVLLEHKGDGTFSDLVAINTGVVIATSSNASGTITSIDATNSGLVLRAYGDQSGMTYSGIYADTATQLFDLSDSIDLTIDGVQGDYLDTVLLANSAEGLEISNMQIENTESVLVAINIVTSGTVTISESTVNGYGQIFSFSGGGEYNLEETIFGSNGKVGKLSSSTLSINGGEWSGENEGLYSQHSTVIIEDLNISIGEGHGTALQVLGGSLNINGEINLNHEAQWSDSTSIGLHTIWSDVIAETVNITGFSTGVSCETTSTLSISTLSITDNTDIGYFQACSESIIDELITSFGDYGLYSKTGEISIETWTASSHTSSLMFSESSAKTYIRNWEGTGSTFAAQGDASELFYGTTTINENLIQVNGAEKYSETNIEITDLSGENVLEGIVVSVHKFNEISNIQGIVTLPLVGQNSNVHAIYSEESISRLKSLSTNDINPRIELPVLPSEGSDWIIDGVNIVLDGFSGELLSNITITSGGSLNLIDSSLTALNVIVETGGILTGTDSKIIADVFAISSDIGDEATSLVLDGNTSITCEWANMNWYGITLDGNVYFTTGSNCELSMFGGDIIGQTNISNGGSIIKFSNLFVSVVDEGKPISSAVVSLDGGGENNEITSAITDISGTTNLRAKSTTYNESGVFDDENLDRIVTMDIDSLDISQTYYWDVSYSSEKMFVASIVNSDEVYNYLNLDSEWSPYYLFEDLVVSGLMEIDNGVDLQTSTNKGLTITGQLTVGSASLHGDDWAGISVNGGQIDLEGSYLLNAIQSISLENSAVAELGNVTLYNSIEGHIMVSSGSSVNLVDSSLELGDNCIKTSNDPEISLNIHFTNISSCNVGIRATGAQIHLNEITMYTPGAGMRLIDVSGSMSNISIDGNFTLYNGPNDPPTNVISEMIGIEILDQINEFLISNIYIDMQSMALSIEDSIGVQLTSLEVSNIKVVRSSGLIKNLISEEINIENPRSSESIILENVNSMSFNASGNSGQSCVSLSSSVIDSVSFNDVCMNMVGGQVGDLSLESTYDLVSTLENTDYNTISVTGLAELTIAQTHYFSATLDGDLIDATFELIQGTDMSPISFIGAQNISIIWKKVTSEGEVDLVNATLSVSFIGALPISNSVLVGPSFATGPIILESNPSPIVSIILPEGLNQISQGSTITPSGTITEINYTATDEHGIASVTWYLLNLNTNEETIKVSNSAYALSELEEGEYSISIIVTDNFNAMTVVTKLFSITPSDIDGDNIDTCVSELWWDDINQRHCGPDNVDKDNDNDGTADTSDAFPLDSCASQDTDSDGKPDKIIENCETSLIIDEDADGNGIIDTKEVSVEGNKNTPNLNFLIWGVLLLAIGSALFRRFKSSEV